MSNRFAAIGERIAGYFYCGRNLLQERVPMRLASWELGSQLSAPCDHIKRIPHPVYLSAYEYHLGSILLHQSAFTPLAQTHLKCNICSQLSLFQPTFTSYLFRDISGIQNRRPAAFVTVSAATSTSALMHTLSCSKHQRPDLVQTRREQTQQSVQQPPASAE